MKNQLYIGLDVHKVSITVTVAQAGEMEKCGSTERQPGVSCLVTAPSMKPKRSGDRINVPSHLRCHSSFTVSRSFESKISAGETTCILKGMLIPLTQVPSFSLEKDEGVG
jgi:hypothetical protein